MSANGKPSVTRERDGSEFTGVEAFLDDEPSRSHPNPAEAPDQVSDAVPVIDDDTEESPVPLFPEAEETPPPKSEAKAGTAPARALWDEPSPPRRRPLPKKAVAAASFALLLLVLPLLLRHRSHATEDTSSTLPEDLVLNERDLKNRVEVTADDFRPRRPNGDDAPSEGVAAPPLSDESGPDTLEERRKRRAQDPEDLIATRGRSKTGGSGTSSSASDLGGDYQRPYVYFEAATVAAARTGVPGAIAPAGTIVPAVLTSPVDLRSGTMTIIAQADADGPIPKSSRFVGSASSDGEGRLALRFERLLLPDGREAKIQGEAQDQTGSFGIEGTVTTEGGATGATVARDLARDTATDVASDALSTFTAGIAGRLLQHTVDRASAQRGLPGIATRRVSLPAGTHFHIFLHQAVTVRT
jgi:type IV secretory pathway VirB10-like protein